MLPYFLFDGKEITVEIPEALDALRAELPHVTITQAQNLGMDPRLIEVVAERVQGALQGRPSSRASCPCVGRWPTGRGAGQPGSRKRYDPGTRLEALAQALRERLGPQALVVPAQAENSVVTVEAAGRALIAQGALRLVVAPYLHFPGKVLADNVIPDVDACVATTRQCGCTWPLHCAPMIGWWRSALTAPAPRSSVPPNLTPCPPGLP